MSESTLMRRSKEEKEKDGRSSFASFSWPFFFFFLTGEVKSDKQVAGSRQAGRGKVLLLRKGGAGSQALSQCRNGRSGLPRRRIEQSHIHLFLPWAASAMMLRGGDQTMV